MAAKRWICLAGLFLVALVGFSGCGPPVGGGQAARFLRLSLEVPSQVQAGETVPLKLTLKNLSDEPVEIALAGVPEGGFAGSYDFFVTTPDGAPLWGWKEHMEREGYAWPAILSPVTLDPGQKLEFEEEWNQVDNWGRPVTPAAYSVLGWLDVRLDVDTPAERKVELETDPKPLVILPE